MKQVLITLLTLLATVGIVSAQDNGLRLDGINDHVITNVVPSIGNGYGNWTIELWVNSPAGPGLGAPNSGPAYSDVAAITWNHPTNIASAMAKGANGNYYYASFGELSANTWYHLAAVCDGGTIKAYKNGALISSTTIVGGSLGANTAPIILGKHPVNNTTTTSFFNGTIDEVRIWNTARTCAELNANINRELVGDDAGLKAYFRCNQGVAGGNNAAITTLTDGSTMASNASIQGSTLNTATSNFIQGVTKSGYVQSCNENALDFTNLNGFGYTAINTPIITNSTTFANWTFECWVRGSFAPTSGFYSGPMYGANMGIIWDHNTASNRGVAHVQGANGNYYTASFGPLAGATWYHLAATYDGSVLRAYKDGVLITSTTVVGGGMTNSTATLPLCKHPTLGGGNYLYAKLDDVRVWTVARSCAEINDSKNRQLAGNESGLLAYYKFNQGHADGDNTGISTIVNSASTGATYDASFLGNWRKTGLQSNFVGRAPFSAAANSACLGTCTSLVGSVVATGVNTTCGANNGSASVPSGLGTYSWSNGATTASINNLAPNRYTVTVTGTNGCTASSSALVAYSGPSTTNTISNTPATCGLNNGSASISSPGTFLWSNGATTSFIANLAPGAYTVTITTTAGCTVKASTTVTAGTAFAITNTATATTCGLNNGSVGTSATAGVSAYLWSNGATTSTITGLAAGNYTVTVTSTTGCTATATSNVAASTGITTTNTATATTCGQNNGSVTTSATTGSYLWSNGATTQTITGLATGGYTVTITSNGCTASFSSLVPYGGPAITTTNTATSTTCGLNNGSVTTSANTGTYLWSNGATTKTLTGLAAGTYTVTVTSNGCTTTATSTVGTSSLFGTTNTASPTTCGLNNGSVSTSASGTYLWSNGGTTSSIANLAAGNYTVTVTNSTTGCTATATSTVATSSSLTTTNTATNASCNLNNGAITTSATGTYVWSNGATTQTITGLAAGSYTVTVTSNGCTATANSTISSSAALTTTNTATATTCGLTNGSASTSAIGSYLWSNGATTQTITGLTAGNYTVTVTTSGCTATASSSIGNSAALTTTNTTTPTTCGLTNGSASTSATGTYVWSNGATTQTITGLTAGTYTVTVTSNGCVATASANVASSNAVSTTNTATATTCGLNNGSVSTSATGTYAWSNGATTQTITAVAAGNYSVTVSANGCTATESATVAASTAATTPIISNTSNTLSTAAGSATYQWYFNGNAITNATTNTHVVTQNGSYTVETTDANGCSAVSAATVIINVGTQSIADLQIELFPNPTNGVLFIQGTEVESAELFSLEGRLVLSQQTSSNLDLSTLPSGIYFIRIRTEQGTGVGKVIKE